MRSHRLLRTTLLLSATALVTIHCFSSLRLFQTGIITSRTPRGVGNSLVPAMLVVDDTSFRPRACGHTLYYLTDHVPCLSRERKQCRHRCPYYRPPSLRLSHQRPGHVPLLPTHHIRREGRCPLTQGCLCRQRPNMRLKLSARGGRLIGKGSVLLAAAAGRSLSAIR